MTESSRLPEPPSCFVTTLDLSLADKLKSDLQAQNFDFSYPPYTLFSAKKKGLSCTLYQSGKLTIQGKETKKFLEFYLEPEILKSFEFTYKDVFIDLNPRIGVDEAGKGDFFGPLCIAGVYVNEETIKELISLKVKDSKNLSDNTVIKMAKTLRSQCMHHIVKIYPKRYNELYEHFQNLNSLLAWGHATVIENLVKSSGCQTVIIDQFAKEHVVLNALKKKKVAVNLLQKHRAEEDLVVAAASILARAAFLEGLEELSTLLNRELPKGASRKTIEVGKALLIHYGKDILKEVSKIHFKTYQVILGDQLSLPNLNLFEKRDRRKSMNNSLSLLFQKILLDISFFN